MSKKFITVLNQEYSVGVEATFNGNNVQNSLFLQNTKKDEQIVKLSPNFPTQLINSTIVGLNSDENLFLLNIKNGEIITIKQLSAGFEYISHRFIEFNGDKSCLLIDTIESTIVDETENQITIAGKVVKVIDNQSTRFYHPETGVLLPSF